MIFAVKWMKLQNIMSEVTQTQKDMHGMYSKVDINHNMQDTHTKLHRPKEAKQEVRPKVGCLNITQKRE